MCRCRNYSNYPIQQGGRHRGGPEDHGLPLRPPPPPPFPPTHFFCVAKRKKGDKGKKERVSKQKLSKGCHLGQNIIVLAILKRLEFENFSSRPTMVADNTFQCFMAHPF